MTNASEWKRYVIQELFRFTQQISVERATNANENSMRKIFKWVIQAQLQLVTTHENQNIWTIRLNDSIECVQQKISKFFCSFLFSSNKIRCVYRSKILYAIQVYLPPMKPKNEA